MSATPMIRVEITGGDDFGTFKIARPIRASQSAAEIRASLIDAVDDAMDTLTRHISQVEAWREKSSQGRA